MKLKLFLFCGFFLLSSISLAAESDRNLHFAIPVDVRSWDPARSFESTSSEVLSLIYETLYQFPYLSDSKNPEPLLASELPALSRNKTVLSIPIREGIVIDRIKRTIEAKDFIYAFKRLALPELRSPYTAPFRHAILGFEEFEKRLDEVSTKDDELKKRFEEPIEGISAPSPRSLVIKLKKANSDFLSLLTLTYTAGIPAENKEIGVTPTGTGPFRMADWKPGKWIRLEKNTSYSTSVFPGLIQEAGKPLPLVAGIELQVEPEEERVQKLFQAGRIDAFLSSIREPRGQEKFAEGSIRSETFLLFQMKDSRLAKHKDLRKAISMVIPRESIIQRLTRGETLWPEGIPHTVELESAKKLVQELSLKKEELATPLRIIFRGSDQLTRSIGANLGAAIESLGLKANLQFLHADRYFERIRRGDFDISYVAWTNDIPDPNYTDLILKSLAHQDPQAAAENIYSPIYVRQSRALLQPWIRYMRLQNNLFSSLKYVSFDPHVRSLAKQR